MASLFVNVKALNVTNNGNGTFTLELQGRELSYEEGEVLSYMFPNLLDQVHKLLSKEALLASLATREQVEVEGDMPKQVKPVDGKKPKYKIEEEVPF